MRKINERAKKKSMRYNISEDNSTYNFMPRLENFAGKN